VTLVKAKTIFWVGTVLLVAALLLLPEPSQFLAGRLNEQALELELSKEEVPAKALYLLALKLQEKNLGLNHINVAKCLDRLSSVCVSSGELDRADAFSKRALQIRLSQDRNHYPDRDLQANYMNLVEICCKQGAYDRAQTFLAKAGTLTHTNFRSEEAQPSGIKCNPSGVFYDSARGLIAQGKFVEAEKDLKRLVAAESYLYGDNFEVRSDLRLYVGLFNGMSKPLEAKRVQALVDSPGKLSAKDLAPYMDAKPNPDDLFYHPILKSVAGHGLDGTVLPDSIYRQLNGCVYPASLMRSQLSTYFAKAELEALSRFCVVAKGKSKREIEKLVGKPEIELGQVGCWSSSKPGDENWVYRLGYLQQVADLTFVNNRCVDSRVLTGEEDCHFQNWRAKHIVSWSSGKTVPEILKEYGWSGLSAYSKGTALNPDHAPVIETLSYSTGSYTDATLTIKHGVCTSGSVGMIAF
jgi:tetratricopeptide (TPR) repeat protein